MKRKSRPPLMVSLRRSQLASLTATIVDFASLIFLVEVAGVWYVTATAVAAFLGALVNFALGRHWTFEATEQAVRGQMLRYVLISVLSLILNSAGVYLLTDHFGIYYMLSKVITAFSVGVLFNFPLHRYFVFGRQKYA
ncbi:MAG TPA: GtrA family protein [Candidatus Acidoferrales bacterium]|nr:GtrA family protein [Candidatus Acidoferrales bacterium]